MSDKYRGPVIYDVASQDTVLLSTDGTQVSDERVILVVFYNDPTTFSLTPKTVFGLYKDNITSWFLLT